MSMSCYYKYADAYLLPPYLNIFILKFLVKSKLTHRVRS